MHALMLKRNFIAQHFLIGKNYGAENNKHSHHYALELEIEYRELDVHCYLLDIIEVNQLLETHIAYFNDKVLNDLPEFKDKNPSIELFSKILWTKFNTTLKLPTDSYITVRIWEDSVARASYRESKK